MNLDELKKILVPPINESVASNGLDWSIPEAFLSTFLPNDYKSYVETYGTSRIDEFFWVLNPFSVNENLNLLNQVRLQTEVLWEMKVYDEIPFNLFPNVGGLIPFAITDNGDVLFWKTFGIPDSWTIIVFESRSSEYQEFRHNMTEFIFSYVNRKIKCKIFPPDVPSENVNIRFYEKDR